jgi:hypothetical protein
VFHVGVQGAPWPFWRQIRVPGHTSIKELGKIIKVAFGWPKKSRSVFFGAAASDIQQLSQEELEVSALFPRVNDILLLILYSSENHAWDHVVRCIDFQEEIDFAIAEKGEGEPPPFHTQPVDSSLSFARVFMESDPKLKAIKPGPRPFDLVAANERLLNRRGFKKKVSYGQNRCRAIIRIDSGPIRTKWENDLNNLRNRIEKLESLIRQFEDLDKPAFQIWLRKRFGRALSRIQETIERITALRQRLHLISLLHRKFRGRKSKAELFELALDIESGKAPWPEEDTKETGQPVNLENLGRMAQDLSSEERVFLEMGMDDLEAEFGELPPEFGEMRDVLLSKGPAANDHRERCKSIYRKIVLLLHPDRAGEMDQPRLQMWYRAQTAYQSSDLVTLESILDGCAERVVEKSVSELMEAVLESKRQIERLTQRMELLKKDPAWNFASRKGKKLANRERRVEHDLAEQSDELAFELSCLEREIAQFERATQRPRRRKPVDQTDLFA